MLVVNSSRDVIQFALPAAGTNSLSTGARRIGVTQKIALIAPNPGAICVALGVSIARAKGEDLTNLMS